MGLKIYLSVAVLILSTVGAMGQSVGLVLSGGGAKGLSHVGVIKALEEYNIPIDYICGTSMGAIVGSLYAAGLTPDEMLALFKSRELRHGTKVSRSVPLQHIFTEMLPMPGWSHLQLQEKKRRTTEGRTLLICRKGQG